MSDPLVSDHREFIAEARKRCAMSIRNTAVGDWLRDALRRLEEADAENARLREELRQGLIGCDDCGHAYSPSQSCLHCENGRLREALRQSRDYHAYLWRLMSQLMP